MSNFVKAGIFSLLCLSALPAFSARPVDLSQQDMSFLRSFSSPVALKAGATAGVSDLEQVSQSTDFNQTLHVRVKQTYNGYPVWGGDAVLHIPHGQRTESFRKTLAAAPSAKTTMNGVVYQDLQTDLQNAPAFIFNQAQADKAIQEAVAYYEKNLGAKATIENKRSKLIVYVDGENKARWAFHVRFYAKPSVSRPAIPSFIMDAENLKIYREWDEIKTLDVGSDPKLLDNATGGGFGGNRKMGQLVYDGLTGHLSQWDIQRDSAKKLCYLRNHEVTVADYRKGENKIASFSCDKPDPQHNNVYWDGASDEINGGYSPNHDALYAGKIISDMYQAWYKVPPLIDPYNKPLMLTMVTHSPNYDEYGNADPDNAYWDPEKEKMYFGDGETYFYPLTSLGVTAHEISHGFTEQHAGLIYDQQSGGMNEAFSDMAAQAAEYYSLGKNSWQIGPEITKTSVLPVLRYMENPSDDCKFVRDPEEGKNCSLQNANDYDAYVKRHKDDVSSRYRIPNVHLSSGIYNRAFYLLSKEKDWDVRKAFDVMVKANQHYWTSSSTFAQGACGVISAAMDYGYDLEGVRNAFNGVGIDTRKCKLVAQA